MAYLSRNREKYQLKSDSASWRWCLYFHCIGQETGRRDYRIIDGQNNTERKSGSLISDIKCRKEFHERKNGSGTGILFCPMDYGELLVKLIFTVIFQCADPDAVFGIFYRNHIIHFSFVPEFPVGFLPFKIRIFYLIFH